MWDWTIWGALIASFAASIWALTRVYGSVREAVGAVKEVRQSLVGRIDEVSAKAEETATRAAAAGDTVELEQSVARLRVSLARLAVLRNAIDEVGASLERVTSVVPLR